MGNQEYIHKPGPGFNGINYSGISLPDTLQNGPRPAKQPADCDDQVPGNPG